MNTISFGKWMIIPSGIEWKGSNEFMIEKETLADNRMFGEATVFDWPVYLASKPWLSIEDLYAFNIAFLFALDHFKVEPWPDISVSATFLAQQAAYEARQ